MDGFQTLSRSSDNEWMDDLEEENRFPRGMNHYFPKKQKGKGGKEERLLGAKMDLSIQEAPPPVCFPSLDDFGMTHLRLSPSVCRDDVSLPFDFFSFRRSNDE